MAAIVTGLGIVVSSIAAALSAVAIARINATKTDVGKATDQAAAANTAAVAANTAAVEARDYSAPCGNGYANESRATWARIEMQLGELSARQVRTNAWLTRHLADHAQAHVLGEASDTDNEGDT